MDSRLFRLPTKPNFYTANTNAFDIDQQQKRSQIASPNSRFPGWAAPMADGRLVTDFQNHCSKNIPVGNQFATKEWLTANAEDIIRLTRERLSQQTGAQYKLDSSVVPPPAMVVNCRTDDCTRTLTEKAGGIGTERGDAPAPELFGTWTSPALGAAPKANVGLTTHFEGGRNTPRGSELR
jgi:hypothetical protein